MNQLWIGALRLSLKVPQSDFVESECWLSGEEGGRVSLLVKGMLVVTAAYSFVLSAGWVFLSVETSWDFDRYLTNAANSMVVLSQAQGCISGWALKRMFSDLVLTAPGEATVGPWCYHFTT